MRAFLFAVLAAVVITAVAALVLDRVQTGSDTANTTSGVRINFAVETTNKKQ
jgi:hypothetical protein